MAYTIVETSKMAMEDVGAFNDITHRAGADLENGRLGEIGVDGKVIYASANTGKKLYLIANVEKTYETKALEEFYVQKGKLVRLIDIQLGDEFGTNAIGETNGLAGIAEKDVLAVKPTTGEFIKKGSTTPDMEFTVIGFKFTGKIKIALLKRTK